MRHTLNSYEKGFSLVEMAISLVVIGILLVPALHGYSLYLQEQKREQTKDAVETASRSINNFLSIYGRYPCPADPTQVLGDDDYGREARNASDDGCDGAVLTSVDSTNPALVALGDEKVFIGAIPFRQLNLPHEVIYDGNNNQLTYAVTEALTDGLSFGNDKGGIRVEDEDGVSMAQNPAGEESVIHYVILSHGENASGAISREGVEVAGCASAPALEQNNCERTDATFGAGQIGDDFDDIIIYQTFDEAEQWQTSSNSDLDIHLRPGRQKFAVGGIGLGDDTSGFADVEISLEVTDDSTLLAEDTTLTSDTGSVKSNSLCLEDASKCFNPNLIAGKKADGSLYCPGTADDPEDIYLIGVSNGEPICTDEVKFKCPNGQYVVGFHDIGDLKGSLICNGDPPDRCDPKSIKTTCGPFRNVEAFYSGGKWYGYGFSGECHMMRSDLDESALESDIDAIMAEYDNTAPGFYDGDGNCTNGTDCDEMMDRIRDLISDYNNETRNTVSCGDAAGNSLVRDTFECKNAQWDEDAVRTLEKLNDSSVFSTKGPLFNGGSHPAETNGASYNAAAPMSVDSDNSDYRHDCWCREDYKFIRNGCANGLSGDRFLIQKHSCPRTNSGWDSILGGYNTDYCGCVESVVPDTESCADHFNVSNGGVAGDVPFTSTTSCATGSPVTTGSGYDTSACFCPYNSDNKQTVDCPTGTTNAGFTYDGVAYPAGTNKLVIKEWYCPTGTPAPGNPNPEDTPVSSKSEAGRYLDASVAHVEPCDMCDAATPPKIVYESCDPGYVGIKNSTSYSAINSTAGGRAWEVEWNCSTGAYNEIPNGTLKANNCFKLSDCSLREGEPDDVTESAGAPYPYNAIGPCYFDSSNKCVGGPTRCFKVIGEDQYQNYNGCTCEGIYDAQ